MPESILNELYSFIKATTKQIRKLHINFYGGEPLIDKDKFISIVSTIKNICGQNKCHFSIAIVTNGFNLNRQVIDYLFDLGINVHLQITLDGPKDVHDRKRILHNGIGTFDRIIFNLKYLKEKNDIKKTFETNLRVNANADDHDNFYELCQFLKNENLFGDFEVYAATIFDEDKYVCNDVNKNNAFDEVGYKLNKHVAKLKGKEFESSCTTLFSGHQLCTQLMRNALLIDPAGDVYKCYMDITEPTRCMGNISEIYKLRSNKNYLDILTKTKMDVPMCKDCQALPLCITFCPRDTILKNICHCYKELIRHELDIYVKHSKHFRGSIVNHIGFID